MFGFLARWWQRGSISETEYLRKRAELLETAPIPTFWMFGKTGSGKSSIIRYLTGAEEAEVGNGFRPQTKTSQRFDFPSADDPLMTFLDTRGIGEAGYDPTEEIALFAATTQLVIVVVRVMDHALEDVLNPLRQLRNAGSGRPVLLALTCLHQADPTVDHSANDLFATAGTLVPDGLPSNLERSLRAQLSRFEGLFDAVVPLDFTPPEEGFAVPAFGGQRLKESILLLLPAAYRQTLLQLDELVSPLKSIQHQRAQAAILSASTLSATAAAVPLPWVDLPVVFGIQTHLAYRLGSIYDQQLSRSQWGQLMGIAGGRALLGMAVRELLKVIPWVGMAANAAAAFAYTFAMGTAWNWYFHEVKQGHVPSTEELQRIFREQLTRGAQLWKTGQRASDEPVS